METALKAVMWLLPLVFGVGFLAPVIAQSMEAAGLAAPFGLTPLLFGLLLGGGWGLIATLRKRWL